MPVTYTPPTARALGPLGAVLGVIFSGGLFVGMVWIQIMNESGPEKTVTLVPDFAMPPPQIEELIEEEPPPPPEPEDPPELQEPPPPISLEMLDAALNVGSGGSGTFDFGLPDMDATETGALSMEDFVNLEDLDQDPGFARGGDPRPLLAERLKRSSRLARKYLSKSAEWSVEVTFRVGTDGRILEIVELKASDSTLEETMREVMEDVRPNVGTVNGQPVRFELTVPIAKKRQ